MSTITVPTIPLDAATPAQRLRRQAAAVRVCFTWWGVHRTLTAQQKEEVSGACGADVRLLSAGKKIIDVRHEAFRKLTSTRSRIVNYWRGLTLPYVEPGVRLIKQADITAFVDTLTGFKSELSDAEQGLDAVYDSMKADAAQRLGRLFDPFDYPPQVRGLFGVDWEFPSVEPPSYLMQLHPDLYAEEQKRVAQRFEEAVQLAEQAFLTELDRLVSHLTERLATGDSGQRQVFRDSVITNLAEFFERFKKLNVRSNRALDQLVEQAQQLVRGVTPQDLRDDNALRQHIAMQMSRVQSQLDTMIVDRPRRRIIRSNPSANGGQHATAH